MSSPLPPNFIDLDTACRRLNMEVNVMGAVTDFLPPSRSRGTDCMSTFTIIDPSYAGNAGGYEQGLRVRFFKPMESQLPAIRGTGDVVLLRTLRIREYHGMTIGLSSRATSWVVFPAASIPENLPLSFSQLQHVKEPRAPLPTAAEMQYAITVCNSQDRSSFTDPIPEPPPASASIATPSSGPVPANRSWKDKFSLVKDVVCETYYDLVGQVVKLYAHSDRVELYLTDYTSHNLLWNYEWGQDDNDGSGPEGDVYNYAPRSAQNQKWSGPFGKLTLTVTLWPPHSHQVIKENDFVHLRNARIKWSQDKKLEGVLHSDRRYPDRIDVTILKNHEDDDRVKDVLRRKREYMKKFEKSSEAFVAEARGLKRKAADESKPLSKTAQRKKRKQERERVAKLKDQNVGQVDDMENITTPERKKHSQDSASLLKPQKQDLNKNVNCSNHLITPRPLSSISSLINYGNTTPNGASYNLPFQNINSRATVRVIDFFPPDVVDFAVRCPKPSEYTCLSDADDSQTGSDSETQSSNAGSQSRREERPWEWRFALVLKDARSTKIEEKDTMTVYVAGQDAECLLKLDAENLRESPTTLAELREKLFLLWGDLEEQKCRKSSSLQETDGNSRPTVQYEAPKSRAFQCCLKEYGVKLKVKRSIQQEESGNEDYWEEKEDNWVWERRWRMFGTTIV